ncbi:PAP2-domain-containing protein [Schizophyllum commune H4-8]|nr:PAP2-domain-containing protein [Schizophyllum commune H4-8]KAI5899649.1 PAP2-domain-containing protein [Schizophyllum commune H4-8]
MADEPHGKSTAQADPAWKRIGLRFLDRADAVSFLGSCAAILYTRSAGVTYVPVCGLACSISVKFLKKIIRQPRPAHPKQRKRTYGMPSTHSAVVAYFSTYVLLASARLPIHPSLPLNPLITRTIPALIIVPWATLVACSRVWLRKHSWIQVVAGCAYGTLFASIAFSVWTRGELSQYNDWIEGLMNKLLATFLRI